MPSLAMASGSVLGDTTEVAMSVADLLELFGLFLFISFLGFKWGTVERAASDYIDEAMK